MLRALEAELDEGSHWDAQRLAATINRLDDLMQKRKDLAVFVTMMAPEKRRFVGELDSPKPIITQLGRMIYELRARSGKSESELTRLDRLSEYLATLASALRPAGENSPNRD